MLVCRELWPDCVPENLSRDHAGGLRSASCFSAVRHARRFLPDAADHSGGLAALNLMPAVD